MLDGLAAQGIARTDILHTAESMFHDHAPANRHGLHNCWIYRRHDKQGFGATRDPGTCQPLISGLTAWPRWWPRIRPSRLADRQSAPSGAVNQPDIAYSPVTQNGKRLLIGRALIGCFAAARDSNSITTVRVFCAAS